jgi:hypothetical protein
MNIATEADLANGTRGTIEQIVLDLRELEQNENGTVLKYPPAKVIFKPYVPHEMGKQ